MSATIEAGGDVRGDSFPVPSRQTSGVVDGTPTEVSSLSFSDKILVTITQEGRLSQWVGYDCDLSMNIANKSLDTSTIDRVIGRNCRDDSAKYEPRVAPIHSP
jgi:hypothetical protein